jgi:hypothetical protein
MIVVREETVDGEAKSDKASSTLKKRKAVYTVRKEKKELN